MHAKNVTFHICLWGREAETFYPLRKQYVAPRRYKTNDPCRNILFLSFRKKCTYFLEGKNPIELSIDCNCEFRALIGRSLCARLAVRLKKNKFGIAVRYLYCAILEMLQNRLVLSSLRNWFAWQWNHLYLNIPFVTVFFDTWPSPNTPKEANIKFERSIIGKLAQRAWTIALY